MIILDTNVLSALMLIAPDPSVTAWLNNRPSSSIWTTSITVYEIRVGLLALPRSRRRQQLEMAFEQVLKDDLELRILSFDLQAAEYAANLDAKRQKAGRPIDFRDTQIAGIALASRAKIATRNTKHFADLDVPVINPWKQERN